MLWEKYLFEKFTDNNNRYNKNFLKYLIEKHLI